jgi:hypothetical protein
MPNNTVAPWANQEIRGEAAGDNSQLVDVIMTSVPQVGSSRNMQQRPRDSAPLREYTLTASQHH